MVLNQRLLQREQYAKIAALEAKFTPASGKTAYSKIYYDQDSGDMVALPES